MKRIFPVLLALALLLSLLPGCGTQNSALPSPAASAEPAQAQTRTFTDSAGRAVEIPTVIDRIAPSGPLAQIVLFSLVPKKFVCIATEWPEEASEYLDTSYLQLPATGQLYGTKGTLNLESLAAVNPQIVIDIGDSKEGIAEDMDALQEQLGIPVVFIEGSMAGMADTYRMLGELLGVTGEADVLADYCDEINTNTVNTLSKIGDHKVKVLYCLGEEGTSVIARDSYHAEVIDLLGDNVAVLKDPSGKGLGNEVDFEQLYRWEPDVVLFAPDSVYEQVSGDARWQELDAVAEGRCYEVPSGPYNWMGFPPSVNRYLGIIWLSELLYPDAFDYNLFDETVRYYELFYHCTLTGEQFAALTEHALPQK